MNQAIFSKPVMARRYITFTRWLERRVGTHKAAITVNRYVAFFSEIERTWGDIPSYQALLKRYGAAGLRRSELPMCWFAEAEFITVDKTAQKDDSERRRIAVLLANVSTAPQARAILTGYHEYLSARVATGKTSLRSVRLALSPASRLLLLARKRGMALPDQRTLTAFLDRSPGQRAALSGFAHFLRARYGAEIVLPRPTDRARHRRRKRLEDELIPLLGTRSSNQKPDRRFLEVALAYFHDMPRNLAGRAACSGEVRVAESGWLSIAFEGQAYAIPSKMPTADSEGAPR